MKDKKIESFMKKIKIYFNPIANLINFDSIEDYLYKDTIGNIEDDDCTMDFIFTLIDFMIDSQKRNKKETIQFYKTIEEFMQNSINETELSMQILNKRLNQLEKGE